MHIREFSLARDFGAALELWTAAGPDIGVGRSDTLEELAKKVAHDPDLCLVAEADGRLAGTVLGGFDGRRGMIYHLAVAPDRRRQGLGRTLLAEVEHRLAAKGCRRTYLLVRRGNAEALGFYASLGWDEMDVHALAKDLA